MTYVIRYGREVHEDLFSPEQLSKKAILYDEKDIGKLTICSNESVRHFLAKSILVFHLLRLKHRVISEAEVAGIGRLDVFDITTSVNYEIESEKSIANSNRAKEKYRQAGIELVIIQIRNWNDSISWLDDYIKHWIRPD